MSSNYEMKKKYVLIDKSGIRSKTFESFEEAIKHLNRSIEKVQALVRLYKDQGLKSVYESSIEELENTRIVEVD